MAKSEKPDLSVIISSYNSEETIKPCLKSIASQSTDKTIEIILIDSSIDNTAKIVRDEFDFVKLYHFKKRKYCGDARNFGISVAASDIIAFIDSDCMVDPGWADNVLIAHRSDHLVVGGIIDNGDSKNPVGWAYYFCEFNLWMPSIHSRKTKEIKEIAGCCLSMKRRAFDMYGPFIKETYSSDTAFHWKLIRDGHRVLQDPAIKVYHTAKYDFRSFLFHVFTHRKHFAEVMLKNKKISVWDRIGLIFFSPLLPPVLFLKIFIQVFSSKTYRREFLLCSPVLFSGLIARALGEFVGFTQGKQKKRDAVE